MITDPKEVVRIWEEELKDATQQIVSAALTNQGTAKKTYETYITIPAPLGEAVVRACKRTGANAADVFARMASDGFEQSLNSQMNLNQPAPQQERPDPAAVLRGAGLDFSGLQEKLNQMNNMVGQVGELGNALNGVGGLEQLLNLTNLTGETQKNSPEPDVPSRKVDRGGSE